MKSSSRVGRVADVIQREVATLLQKDFRDPKLGFVTISTVEVSADLSYAKIFITTLKDEDIKDALKILNNAAGLFRTALSKKMQLRQVPKLRFVFDESVSRGNRITALINKVQVDLPPPDEEA